MTIYLYKKTHNKTGLKYLGKTAQPDPHKYKGSGEYWSDHIRVHGYDVTTEILRECQTNEEIKHWGLYYSELWNVVNERDDNGNKTWANCKPEEGDGGALPESFWQEKYQVSNPSQLPSVKLKKEQTTFENFGVTHNSQSPEIKQKKIETTNKSLGVNNPSQSSIVKEKKKETLLKNYGVDNPMLSKEITDKIKSTNLQRYGVENVFQAEEIKEKHQKIMQDKYGVDNASQLPHVRELASIRMRNAPMLICPHCGKEGNNKPNMMKHHFDRCKHKKA
jgi:hypothetical protein